jgi:hypothetical protein
MRRQYHSSNVIPELSTGVTSSMVRIRCSMDQMLEVTVHLRVITCTNGT